MRLPIRVRMTAWYVALLAVIIAAVGAFLVLRLHADLVAATDRRLESAIAQIARGYHAEGRAEARDVAATVLRGESGAAQVLAPDGRVLVSYGDRVAATPMLPPRDIRLVLAGARPRRTTALGGRSFRLFARAASRHGAPGVVVAAESTDAVGRSVHRLLVLLLLACPAALLATAAGGWWLARRALRPVERLTSEADRIGIDRLAERLPVGPTGDEVAHLAATLNTMLARLESGVAEQRRLVADASHELRTPLAAMRAELDVSLRVDDLDPAARETLLSTREEVERLSRTVDGLLLLARADQGELRVRAEPVELGVVAADAVRRLRPLARAAGVAIETGLGAAPVQGDDARLGQAVANLLDNAIEFSPPGSTVTVTTGCEDGDAEVRVADEGPGIPAAAREEVFGRFRRLDASRTRATGGAGLGLAIVREIAAAHGGRTWMEPGARGGSVFVLALPTGRAAPRSPGDGARAASPPPPRRPPRSPAPPPPAGSPTAPPAHPVAGRTRR
jgi:heavy metal sensor kinase